MDHPVLSVGLCFKNIKDLRMTLKQYAIRNSFDIEYVKNDKSCITAKCSNKDCKWRLHAYLSPGGQTFEVKNLTARAIHA